jgi:nitrate reductase gamma subunit
MTMEQWLLWARGPLFLAAMAVLIAGTLRIVGLSVANLVLLVRESRRNGRSVPWANVARATLRYVVPARTVLEARGLFSLTSIVFHVAIIVTPLFLGAHLVLWQRGLQLPWLRWPTLPAAAADVLSVIAVVSVVAILVLRVGSAQARAISRFQDYFLPALIAVPFASGLLAMHPAVNPFGYTATMLVHVLSGNLILILIPFSKLSHVALFPFNQLISELGWHLKPGAGELVAADLGKENAPI